MNTPRVLILRKNLWSQLLLETARRQFILETVPWNISKTKQGFGNPKTTTTKKEEKITFLVQEALDRKTGV
jgi:hypothetical protein